MVLVYGVITGRHELCGPKGLLPHCISKDTKEYTFFSVNDCDSSWTAITKSRKKNQSQDENVPQTWSVCCTSDSAMRQGCQCSVMSSIHSQLILWLRPQVTHAPVPETKQCHAVNRDQSYKLKVKQLTTRPNANKHALKHFACSTRHKYPFWNHSLAIQPAGSQPRLF